MPYCANCGAEQSTDAQFCEACGADLGPASADLTEESTTRQRDVGTDPPPAGRSGATRAATAGINGQPAGRGTGVSAPVGRSREVQAAYGGGILVVIAAFLPWLGAQVLATSVSVTGVQGGDGVITLVLAAVPLTVAAWRWNRYSQAFVALGGAAVTLLAGSYIVSPLWNIDLSQYPPTQQRIIRRAWGPKIGLYLTVLGGLLMVGGILWAIWRARQRRSLM